MRGLIHQTSVIPMLAAATGPAAIIYTFFMLPDPATTPSSVRGQIAFGLAVGAVYLLLVSLHIVFGLFFGLTIVCAIRGLGLSVWATLAEKPIAPPVLANATANG